MLSGSRGPAWKLHETPKRPWWRRKRWWGVGLFWLVAIPPLAVGPVQYSASRGWLPASWVVPLLRPVVMAESYVVDRFPAVETPIAIYNAFWSNLIGTDGVQPTAQRRTSSGPRPRPVRGELPRLMPERGAPGEPIDSAELPPLPQS
ncbi:MAG TPA: hypothetical protein VF170_00305 [Planctomycetaceae bacterium]